MRAEPELGPAGLGGVRRRIREEPQRDGGEDLFVGPRPGRARCEADSHEAQQPREREHAGSDEQDRARGRGAVGAKGGVLTTGPEPSAGGGVKARTPTPEKPCEKEVWLFLIGASSGWVVSGRLLCHRASARASDCGRATRIHAIFPTHSCCSRSVPVHAVVSASARGFLGCLAVRSPKRTSRRGKGTVRGPGRIVAVLSSPRYHDELLREAGLALVEMERSDCRRRRRSSSRRFRSLGEEDRAHIVDGMAQSPTGLSKLMQRRRRALRRRRRPDRTIHRRRSRCARRTQRSSFSSTPALRRCVSR